VRLNITYGLAAIISTLLCLGAFVLGVLAIRVAYAGDGGFVDASNMVWAGFGVWNLLVSLVAAWAALQSWRGFSLHARRPRDNT
jgi:hypothetical protein